MILRISRITLLGILGTFLQLTSILLSSVLHLKSPINFYFRYGGTTLLLFFFIGFYFKQNSSIFKNVTLISIMGQCFVLVSYIITKISLSNLDIYLKNYKLDTIGKYSRYLDNSIMLNKVNEILLILSLAAISSFFIVAYTRRIYNDFFKKYILLVLIIEITSILAKLFDYIALYLLPYDILDSVSMNTHDKLTYISGNCDLTLYYISPFVLFVFFIILYIRQRQIKEV
jgi:hypothetical protein